MINDIMKWFIVCAVLLLAGCSEEALVPGTDPGSVPEGKVMVEVYTDGMNYDKPVTRTGKSEEELADTRPWVLVFYEQGSGFIFAEAQQAIYSGNKSYVTLNITDKTCRVLILGNTPSELWSFGTGPYTPALFADSFAGETFDDVVDSYLQTAKLSSPSHPSVPYTGAGGSLPMAVVVDVNGITESTKFGTELDKLQMKRVVAKVTVHNEDPSGDFVLHSVTVMNTARNVRLWEKGSTPRSNLGDLTSYFGTGSDRAAQMADIAKADAAGSTEANPLYIYETSYLDGTMVILHGSYKGTPGFYRLPFRGADGSSVMDIIRNKYYKFHIEGVTNHGYLTPEEAMMHSAEDVQFRIDVTDQSSYEISDNGVYYMGLSHSEVLVQWFDAFTAGSLRGYFNDEPAFIVTTNAPHTVTTEITATVTESIPQIGTPVTGTLDFTTTGPSSSKINVAGVPTTTEVRVTFDKYFQAGYLTIRVGDIVKQVDVRRDARLSTAAFTRAFTIPGGGYVSAEMERGSQWFNVSFTANPATGAIKAASPDSDGGTLYLFGDNFFSTYYDRFRSGIATLVRGRDSRRVKVYLDQMSNIQKQRFSYVATFHRHDQVGERLILMEGTNFDNYGHVPTVGEWSATVIHGHDFIRMDTDKCGRDVNDATKAWAVGTDAEDYLVADNGPVVSGVCDALNPIYFRIGMKDKIAADETRFGAVLLSFNNGAQNYLIFVRQGEEPTEVVGPGKWAVYNLSDPYRTAAGPANGGTVISDHNLVAPQQSFDKKYFTDYPSQAGYYYQWGVMVNSGGYKRYAYHPCAPGIEGVISGFPTTIVNYVYNLADDPCPAGYRLAPRTYYHNATGGLAQYLTEPVPGESEGSITYMFNSQWGYCADGFYDRHPFDDRFGSTVAKAKDGVSGNDVATPGRVFYNTDNFASVFFPTAGHRNFEGQIQSLGLSNAQYWTSDTFYLLTFGANSLSTGGGTTNSREYARPVRCIKE